MNWIEKEARNADPTQDRVVLENPEVMESLDEILMEQYYPPIKRALEETGLPYRSVDDGEIPIESSWDAIELGRRLVFMLFDQFGSAILRGSLTRMRHGYMFKREFFLDLPKETDPSFLFRIISDEAFAGMIPGLTIQPSVLHPEWDSYYSITLEAGTGMSSSHWTLDQAVIGDIEETIKVSVDMYDDTIGGFETMADVEEFIQLAQRCFGQS